MSPEKEREHYTKAVITLLCEYENRLSSSQPENAFSYIVNKYLDTFIPPAKRTPQVEALVRATFVCFENFNMLMCYGPVIEEECNNICGHLGNVLIDIALDDWDRLNTYTLA